MVLRRKVVQGVFCRLGEIVVLLRAKSVQIPGTFGMLHVGDKFPRTVHRSNHLISLLRALSKCTYRHQLQTVAPTLQNGYRILVVQSYPQLSEIARDSGSVRSPTALSVYPSKRGTG
jgi:hypothetical protein